MDFDPEKQILYEDNHLIIINKYPSQIVQADKTGDEALSEQIKRYLKIKYDKPGNVFCGVLHRLDRPVGGALIFARTSKSLARMNEQIKNREIKKTYWAVVKNPPPDQTGHLIHYINRNQKINKSFIVSEQTKGAKKAELVYTYLQNSEKYHLLEIELLTGRHHQIRAQLAFIGCPIKGDVKYGFPRTNPDASIHLFARKLEFLHPVKKEKIIIEAPLPDDALWNCFK